jgi:hypothetical protein
MKVATSHKKNEQQQDAKNNAKSLIKWTTMTWKTFEETVRRSHSRSIKAYLVMDDDKHYLLLFPLTLQSSAGYGLLFDEVSWSHTTTNHSLWDSCWRVVSSSQSPLPDNTEQTNIYAQLTRHNTPIHNILSRAPQLSISQKALGTLAEDGNVMPKRVGVTIHN